MKALAHRILLVDDNIDEQFLSKRALNKLLNPGSSLNTVNSGNEAISYLIGEGKFADRTQFPFPSLIIVDLNMNDGDGFDILEFLQGNPAWSVVPKVMFSSSENDDDIRTAYRLGASVYHVKPTSPRQMDKRLQQILEYWALAQVPPVDETGRLLEPANPGRRGTRYPQPKGGKRMKRPNEP